MPDRQSPVFREPNRTDAVIVTRGDHARHSHSVFHVTRGFVHSVRDGFCCLLFCSPDVSIRAWDHMPRYYFHFRAGSSLSKDEIGEVLADASAALQHARKIALELVRGGEATANAFIIVVEGSQQLFEVPLSEQAT
jgi:hypothetical protein